MPIMEVTSKAVCILLVWSIVSFHDQVDGKRYNKCPKYCACVEKRKSMTCDGKVGRLHVIPKAPPYVTSVKLINIQLGRITRNMVANLTHCKLTSLIMSGNNISRISADAFRDLSFLTKLTWQQQSLPLKDLPLLFQNIRSNLQRLSLGSNGGIGGEMDSKIFTRLQYLTHLTLNLGDIKIFNATSLSEIVDLDSLDLSGNRIVSLVVEMLLPNVTKVNLEGNNMVEVPEICRPNTTSLIPRLKNLNVGNNAIRALDVSSLACLHNLEKLTLSRNRIEHIETNVFANLPELASLQISDLWALKSIKELAFNSSSLKKLIFTGNPALNNKNFHPKTIFKNTPNLAILDLTNTKLKIHLDELKAFLLNLKNIEKLTLQSVAMGQLPSGLFSQLTRLAVLSLSGNYISNWNKTVFENVTSIKHLSIDGCNIKLITEDSFPLEFRLSVKEINLSNNPYTCTCDLLWFRTWLDQVRANHSIVFTQYPHRYECRSPNVKRLRLKDFHPTVKSCTITQPYSIILTIVLSVCIVFTVAGLVTYRYRWYILYWISLMRRRRQRQGPPKEIQYDGFVSYSNPDWDWVSSELLDFLEGQVGMRLCEHSRDFKAGVYIVDNVIEAMETSRKTILVISNEYMKSDWCQFELKMTLSSFLDKDIDIVVILLEHIKAINVTTTLRALMVSTTYIEWSDDPEAKRLFRDRIQNAMRE